MKKFLLLMATLVPMLASAQGWPASYGGVVLAASSQDDVNAIISNAATINQYFDLILLPEGVTVSAANIQSFAAANTGFIAYIQSLDESTAQTRINEGYWGYRYRTSETASTEAERTAKINAVVKPTFAIGDWYANKTDVADIKKWIQRSYADFHTQAAILDNSLNEKFKLFNDYNFQGITNNGVLSDFYAKRYGLNYVGSEVTYGSNKITKKSVRMAAYAFIMAMPGTPVVFYSDWKDGNYTQFLKQLIAARRAAGITNQAAIYFEAENESTGSIKWRIQGTNGNVKLSMGYTYYDEGTPSGYTNVWNVNDNDNKAASFNIDADAKTRYIDYIANPSHIKGNNSDALGFAVIDKRSGHYNGTVSVNIKPSNSRTTLAFTTNGNDPDKNSERITSAGRTLNLTKTTTLKVAVVENDGSTVKVNTMETRKFIIDTKTVNTITVYVRRGDSDPSAPYVWAWHNNGSSDQNFYTSDTQWTKKRNIGGIDWWYDEFQTTDPVGLIFKETAGGIQTSDIKWVDRDAFFVAFDNSQSAYLTKKAWYSNDITNIYIEDVYNPKVSIDKASGDYKNWVQPTLSATMKDAVIVYTTDGSIPTASHGTQVTGPYKIESDIFKYAGTDKSVTLRAGILYNGQVINLVARTYHIVAPSSTPYGETIGVDNDGINIFVRRTADNQNSIYIYYWESGQAGKWTSKLATTKKVGEQTWYYYHFDKTAINIIFNVVAGFPTDGNKQSNDISLTTSGNYFFHYNGIWKDDATNETSTYSSKLSEGVVDNNYVDTGNEIPSCASYLNGVEYFYYENSDNYVVPYAWVYNGNKVFSADCWPGSAFIEPIGTAPSGSTIYRWTWIDDGSGVTPAFMNFDDNGGNVKGTSQTNEYGFRTNGYYNTSGWQGDVKASYVTLAEAIRYATEDDYYYITDDLTCVHVSKDGKRLYAKDSGIETLNPFYPNPNFTIDETLDDNAYAYDQSNWVEIILPDELAISESERANYIGNVISGGTLYGQFKTRNNPVMEIATGGVLPIFNPSSDYSTVDLGANMAKKAYMWNSFDESSVKGTGDYNLYHTANFLPNSGDDYNESGNTTFTPNVGRFYVNPKIDEVAIVRWAIYQNGEFYAPSRGNIYQGRVKIQNDIKNDDVWYEGQQNLTNGQAYILKAIVKNKKDKYPFKTTDQKHNAPRRVPVVSGSPVSEQYEIILIDAYSDDVLTGINTVAAPAAIERVKYYNLMGVSSDKAFDGVNIVVTRYTDGTQRTTKVIY